MRIAPNAKCQQVLVLMLWLVLCISSTEWTTLDSNQISWVDRFSPAALVVQIERSVGYVSECELCVWTRHRFGVLACSTWPYLGQVIRSRSCGSVHDHSRPNLTDREGQLATKISNLRRRKSQATIPMAQLSRDQFSRSAYYRWKFNFENNIYE